MIAAPIIHLAAIHRVVAMIAMIAMGVLINLVLILGARRHGG